MKNEDRETKQFSNTNAHNFYAGRKCRVKHYKFWLQILRWKHKFPVMKVTNQLFLNKVRNKSFAKRVGPVFETCTKHLDSSFLIPMEVRLRTIGTRIKKPKIERATGRRKTMVNQQQKKEQVTRANN
jgi:hypothetical protein